MTAQNQALFVTLCTQRGTSKSAAIQALSTLRIPADLDNDALRFVMLKESVRLAA